MVLLGRRGTWGGGGEVRGGGAECCNMGAVKYTQRAY